MKNLFKTLLVSFGAMCVLASCGVNSEDIQNLHLGNEIRNANENHEHAFSVDYAADETHHWHYSLCEHPEEKDEYATHSYRDWQVIRPATMKEKGLKTRKCRVCGYEERKEIEKELVLPNIESFKIPANNAVIISTKIYKENFKLNIGDSLYLYKANDTIVSFKIDAFTYLDKTTEVRVIDAETFEKGLSKNDEFALEMHFSSESERNSYYEGIKSTSFLSDKNDLAFEKEDDGLGNKVYKKATGIFDFLSRSSGGDRNTTIDLNNYEPQAYLEAFNTDVTVSFSSTESKAYPGDKIEVSIQPKYDVNYSGNLYLFFNEALQIRERGHIIGYIYLSELNVSNNL